MKIIDLGATLRHNGVIDPPVQRANITYTDHTGGKASMLSFYPGLEEKDLPGGVGWAYEGLRLGTHTGTHMDAPWHYHPTMDGGKRASTIDELPLEWCVASGVKLDFSDKPDGYCITAADMDRKLQEIHHSLKENEIVFIQSGAAAYVESDCFPDKGCGAGREATNYLTERGVHIVGTDGWSWDRPLSIVAKEYQQTHDKSIVWEGHLAGIEHGYYQIEKLTNLNLLPPDGFTVICIPIKIERASAGWVRPIAILDGELL